MIYGNINYKSNLSNKFEARSIENRPDINSILGKPRQENFVSGYVETGKLHFYYQFSRYIDYYCYTKVVTFVSLKMSMILQQEMANRKIRSMLDHQEIQSVTFTFRIIGPPLYFPIKP